MPNPLLLLGARGATGAGPDAGPVGRDTTCLRDIADRLRATGAFAEVYRYNPWDYEQAPPDAETVAYVYPLSWSEQDDAAGDGEVEEVRRVRFGLAVVVRDDDPTRRDERLDRLQCVAQNALNGKSLAGLSLAPLTNLRRGEYLPAAHPYKSARIEGEFAYLVGGYAAHDESDEFVLI